MNHDFLIGSAQLHQAHESHQSCGCGGHNGGITRRSFIKRTGGATVAVFLKTNGTILAGGAPGTSGHCNAGGYHGKHCSWVSNIKVRFTSRTAMPKGAQFTNSKGKIVKATGHNFTGSLTYTISYCKDDGSFGSYDIKADVHTGGYDECSWNKNRGTNWDPQDPYNTDSSKYIGDDTACPKGDTTTNAHQTGGSAKGFLLNTNGTGRTDIEIHEPGRSSGCIVFTNNEAFKTFADFMTKGNDGKGSCPDSPPQDVPTSISYEGVTPVNNQTN